MANDDDESYQTVTQHIPPSPKPGYVWEVQETKCTAVRYKVLDKLCFRCRARKGILTCVFQNLRAFLVNEKTRSIDAKTAPVFISNTRSARAIAYPPTSRLNGSLDRKARSKIQAAVSPYLIRQLESELAHAQHPDCILQYLSNDSRITCEHCQTTIFAGYWMCHKCGRDMCLNCYPDMNEANARPPVNGIEMHRSAYHRLLSCAGRPRADTGRSGSHAQDDFSPATTIHPDDLARLLADLRAFKAESFPEPEHPAPNLSSDQPDSLRYPYLAFEELSKQRFHHLWARGEPLVVHGVLRRMELKWTPEYFAENFGDRKCTVVDTKSAEGQAVDSTVGNFFRQLGKARADGKPCWKLKVCFLPSSMMLGRQAIAECPSTHFISRIGRRPATFAKPSHSFMTISSEPFPFPLSRLARVSSTCRRTSLMNATRLILGRKVCLHVLAGAENTC